MKSVQIQLTTKCNERCYMCRKYTWAKREIDAEILKEKIEKYKECTFTFSGGDPLAYSNLKELNDMLEKYKVVYQVFTNMNYVIDEEQKRFLKNAKYIQVSLDGSNEIVYECVRNSAENGFGLVFSNILVYNESEKGKVKINCTVSKRNFYDVYNIYKLCKNFGLNVRFFPVHTDDSAKLEPWMVSHILKSFIWGVNEIPKELEVFKKAYSRSDYKGKCYVKKEHRIIDESGKEYPCCRAINDNGEDWDGMYRVENLAGIDCEDVLYDFCKECDRYRKFNEDWENFVGKKELFL